MRLRPDLYFDEYLYLQKMGFLVGADRVGADLGGADQDIGHGRGLG